MLKRENTTRIIHTKRRDNTKTIHKKKKDTMTKILQRIYVQERKKDAQMKNGTH